MKDRVPEIPEQDDELMYPAHLRRHNEAAEAFPGEFERERIYTVVKDSGAREEMPTGAVRDTREGKGRYDLLPPKAMRRLAVHYENGAKKYGDHNWQKGMPVSRCLDSALRHLFAYLEGKRDEDHLAAAAWNVMTALHFDEVGGEMADVEGE